MSEPDRRLAAILAADIVGYSARLGANEGDTIARVRALRDTLITPSATTHAGRLFKTTGDGFLLAFPSAVQALRCALAIQTAQRANPAALPLRIGIHQGEVIPEGDDLLGDAVVIAARLEPLAEPHGIVISARVREDAQVKLDLATDDLGTPALKNITAQIHAHRVRLDAQAPARPTLALPDKPSLVVLPFQNMSGDPEQDYFADGMVEDITTALSSIRALFVALAVSAARVGRVQTAEHAIEGVRRLMPSVGATGIMASISSFRGAVLDRVVADLRLAGLAD